MWAVHCDIFIELEGKILFPAMSIIFRTIEKSAKIGAYLATQCVEEKGTQNHEIDKKGFQKFLKTV